MVRLWRTRPALWLVRRVLLNCRSVLSNSIIGIGQDLVFDQHGRSARPGVVGTGKKRLFLLEHLAGRGVHDSQGYVIFGLGDAGHHTDEGAMRTELQRNTRFTPVAVS